MSRPREFQESDFDIRPSAVPGAGMGLFARTLIEPGDTIGRYTGRVLTDDESDEEPYVSSLYLLWVCKDHWIYGEGPEASYTRYINHCHDHPNAEIITSNRWKTARIAATRVILPGEEILFDYGAEYWETLGIDPSQGKHGGK